jgi:hypothetical protein
LGQTKQNARLVFLGKTRLFSMGLILIFGLSTSVLHQPKRRKVEFCFDVPIAARSVPCLTCE